MQRDDAAMLDVRVWTAVLLVQSVPYLASLLVSLISALPRLPASLVGTMTEMRNAPAAAVEDTPPSESPTAKAEPAVAAAPRTRDG
jgi:hypothetical protein